MKNTKLNDLRSISKQRLHAVNWDLDQDYLEDDFLDGITPLFVSDPWGEDEE